MHNCVYAASETLIQHLHSFC